MAKLGDFIPDKIASPRQWVGSVGSVLVLSLVVGVGLFIVSQITGRIPGARGFFWTPDAGGMAAPVAPLAAVGPVYRTHGVA